MKLLQAEVDDTKIFKPMTVDLRSYRFYFGDEDLDEPIYNALAPRVGDINLDGYPDILLRTQNPSTNKVATHLLLNVPVNQENEIIVSNVTRGFELQNEVMEGESSQIILRSNQFCSSSSFLLT